MQSNRELALLVAQDDRQAYNQLYSNFYKPVYAVMLQYTKNAEDAEDILQLTFLRLWEKRQELPAVKSLEDWIFIIARNEFLNKFRKRRSESTYRQYLLQVFSEEYQSPEELLITRQREELLEKAIASLPERQREAFLLCRQKGFTYEKAAVVMNVSRETVKEHMSRGLKSLKSFLLANLESIRMFI
ncbi:RNA polymerase sigma-70 factor [Chitinophaga sp. 212800010-3]|uniref:RNA polymerase sigma factor n=1 Tax=unclassified Chitinophaga TaxID=2619133 RepID=UPI002DE502CC|nr:hypothetical protein [Chitinophaga sp. 212800010-3]